MSKKSIIIIAVILIVVVLVGYQKFFKEAELPFTLAEVVRGDISQEISETGEIKKGEEINLNFKSTGIIEKIYVDKGDIVDKGAVLIKIDDSQLQIQLIEAKAGLDLYQATLDKLLAGSSPEEIQVSQTTVDNAETTLENAQKNLDDVWAKADEDLNQAYEDALNVLDDAYLKIYNAFNVVDSVLETYFSKETQESTRVKRKVESIETNMNAVKTYVDSARASSTNENIDSALSKMKTVLEDVYSALTVIRETSENPLYHNPVSAADKSSLDTHRGYISTALTNTVNSQQTISSAKITNTTNINTAEATVSSAQGALKAAQDALAVLSAEPRQEDIDLYQAQVNQAKAKVRLLENQIYEAVLRSPADAQITKLHKKVKEMAQPSLQDPVISLLPLVLFEIEVNIYEEDVIKMDIGNPVDISLIAFPSQTFQGEVISIDPAQELIDGVVYYKATINPGEIPDQVKPGMTADLIIKTAFKENVLIIPEDGIQYKEDKKIVEVFKDGSVEEREVVIGLQGSDYMVEVVSGLKEGENIVLH
ncbi:HlyD family efflux transporter periplasmic adaptor subunit [Candidatus Parcubacteria bacterium]|nr:HlyD family efflux transporter periplasmic adaptor subunit [Candidatus Parcubacteria bacterium]